MQFQTNPQLQLAYNFLQYTNQNVFLTGKAGTGKTTFLRNLKMKSPKRMVVVAPTGVAAINAGGVTIHSFFQISFGPQIPHDPNKSRPVEVDASGRVAAGVKRFSSEKINIIRSLDLLVIDEISMVRADLLDAIDEVLRRYKNRYKPFGGVQLLMIGDLQQLAPVVKDDEWDILRNYYDTCFFFSSRALRQSNFIGIELQHIYRQSDQKFIDLLNRVRENRIDQVTLNELNARYRPDFNPSDDEGYITLTTHNYQSQQINESKLIALKTAKHSFKAVVEGDFPEFAYPTDFEMVLKVGAQVMFVKNDSGFGKRYFNGKIGRVTSIGDEAIYVLCPGETQPIEVKPDSWQNAKYALDEQTQEIKEQVIGNFTQYPLKLAWAITIHKSQGLTFERAIIDARLSFAHGQVYVALSRCKTLEGLVLRSPLADSSVINDTTVLEFSSQVEQNQPGEQQLTDARRQYELQLILELFDFNPLFRLTQALVHKWNEEAIHIQGNMGSLFRESLVPVQTEMIVIAEKFRVPLERLLVQNIQTETNEQLQERVKNGCGYFLQKLDSLFEQPLANGAFQTDNKAIRITISEAIDRLEKEILIKKACLVQIQKGFSIQLYLETKSKASIEPSKSTQKSKASVADSVSRKHPELYKQLLAWRAEKADQLSVEISRIIRQDTLLEIAETVPASVADLKAVRGFGGKKFQEFGKEVMALALDYRKNHNMELPLNAAHELKYAGLSTYETSYQLFLEGKTITEISKERNISRDTVFSHLARFVLSGDLEISDLIDQAKYQAIAKVIEEYPSMEYSTFKEKWSDQFYYSEFQLVQKHLGKYPLKQI
jgi:DNA-binding CsgD family transcriptional regulator